ncbi:hypothetical protein FOL46_003893 [Perkinsus olseni]|uniref:Uncharacterized protein n=1 Tax=Perkinsus olseni TaxID=32597 RepID=A0A7J6M0I9_PEROL|nr:hypothetical protein FOL46_003893 [Perkinsus olseni]
MAVPPLSEVKAASEARRRNIEIHSICSYADDPTSNTGLTSELPEMAPRNHQSYADHFGYRYVLHSDLAEGRENMEAHYSKMMVVLLALETSPTIEWLLFIDCDAFFTDFTTSLDALVDTFAPEGSDVAFIVAEDSGGINTGVFMVKGGIEWSKDYLRRVSVAPFTTAWDQSQFFWEAVKDNLFANAFEDFSLPKQSIPLQWMKYCPECAKETSSMPERGATNVHYSLWKRTLAEAGALLESSRMLEEEKIPSRRIFDICDLTYAFAVCAEKNLPKRKREELVKGGVPARLLTYFIEDPERFTKLTVVQLGRLVWSAAVLGLLGKNEAAKAITETLRKDERYKELSGRNLVRVAEALKGVSQAHPGRRHLGDRIMGQVLRQRSDLQKMGLLVEGLRAAGQLTVVNSVTQHKLVDLFLKVIIPEAGTAELLVIPGCLDSIKLADDVVFEEWTNRFVSALTDAHSDSFLADEIGEAAFGETLRSLSRLQVGPPGLTSGALGILVDRMSTFIQGGDDGHASSLSTRALTAIICAFRSLGHLDVGDNPCQGMGQKEIQENSAKFTKLLTLCYGALEVPTLSSDQLLQLVSRTASIHTDERGLLRGVRIPKEHLDRLRDEIMEVSMETAYANTALIHKSLTGVDCESQLHNYDDRKSYILCYTLFVLDMRRYSPEDLLTLLKTYHLLGWDKSRVCEAIAAEGGLSPSILVRSLPYLRLDGSHSSEAEIYRKALRSTSGREAAQCLVQVMSMEGDIPRHQDPAKLLREVLDNALSTLEVAHLSITQILAALMSGACDGTRREEILSELAGRVPRVTIVQIERLSYDFHDHAMNHVEPAFRVEMSRRFREFAASCPNHGVASAWRDAAYHLSHES